MENLSEETNHHSKTTPPFLIVWFDLALLGLNCHAVFLPGNDKIRITSTSVRNRYYLERKGKITQARLSSIHVILQKR